ncbi:MAG TPA: hypothetical protein VL283_04015, partial [Candidatus Baltobacteraceae bacterium]|nr:hypothetical protein [Candidatus Baltobacteraceae bacterium]
MSVSLALIMAATAVLLTLSVCAVLWRKPGDRPASVVEIPPEALPATFQARRVPPSYEPPDDSLFTAQLEVGQTFHLETQTAKYTLTLRDPINGLYDAQRIGIKRDGAIVKERFQMLFKGTFVAYHGLQFRVFIRGGNLYYQKIR